VSLPLADVRVLEIASGISAAFAGRMLRGYGARVRHVQVPGVVPLTEDEASYLHAGKTHEAVPSGWDALFGGSDIIISDRQPNQLRALGLDWTDVRARHPHLVIVSVTPFGLTGPYADFQATNAVSFAMGGIMSLTGDPARTPLVTGGRQAEKIAGLNAFAVAAMSWYGRLRHRSGELVDLSAQECAAGMLELYGPSTAIGGPVMPRLGNQTRAQWGVYPCLDGWAGVFALERQIPALFKLLDDPELSEPRFADPLLRMDPLNEEQLGVKVYVWLMDKTKEELLAAGLANKVPIGITSTPRDLLDRQGLQVRGAFESIAGATIPGRPFGGFGWRPSTETEGDTDRPARDADNGRGAPGQLPLDGIRVVDLSMMWAGPFATMHLAAMGADVIKIESPSAWDNIRTLIPQPGVEEPWNSAYYFNAYNRDKRSLTLDLRQPEGRDLLLRLLAEADVLIENYRADVLDKLGLTTEVLRAANPNLVTVSMAAFGKEGPDSAYVGFGPVIELMSGLSSLTGYVGDGEPFKTGISYCDPVGGLFAVAATVLGLCERDAGEGGRFVDLAQREGAMTLIGEAFVAASRGDEIVPYGCRDDRFAPQGVYRAIGTEQWVVVSVRTDDEWRTLCGIVGRDDLASLTLTERRDRHDELDDVIANWLQTQRPQVAMETLQASGVPAGRVLDSGSIHDDLQLLYRDYWVYLPHPRMIRYKQQGVTWRLVDAAPTPRRHSPFFGEHNAEILHELGLSDEDLSTLTKRAVIADAPINPGVG
jgi:crotonobetainyl-CoA:carnitine CoA-transferase CaiB-like acyl-CoA transferase